jgi:hypothetical protein
VHILLAGIEASAAPAIRHGAPLRRRLQFRTFNGWRQHTELN